MTRSSGSQKILAAGQPLNGENIFKTKVAIGRRSSRYTIKLVEEINKEEAVPISNSPQHVTQEECRESRRQFPGGSLLRLLVTLHRLYYSVLDLSNR